MNRRDLKADLGIAREMKPLNTSEYYEGISLETAQQYMMAAEGWPHAIERAIKAEALTRELVGVIDELRRQINECGLDDEMWEVYERAKEVLGDGKKILDKHYPS